MKLRLLGLLLAVSTLLGGFAVAAPTPPPKPVPAAPLPPMGINYVAMGDSFTSGPWVLPYSNTACYQSSRNYPHLAASALHTQSFKDVSCASANFQDLSSSQRIFLWVKSNPQIDAITATTNLVTVGIGGDQIGLTDLGARCGFYDSSCGYSDPNQNPFTQRIANMGATYIQLIQTIKSKAPKAKVVFIGYPEIFNTKGCSIVSASSAQFYDNIVSQLNAVMLATAQNAGATYIDTNELSDGHKLCDTFPWFSILSLNYNEHPLAQYFETVANKLVQTVNTKGFIA